MESWIATLLFLTGLFIPACISAMFMEHFTLANVMVWWWFWLVFIGPGFILGLIEKNKKE